MLRPPSGRVSGPSAATPTASSATHAASNAPSPASFHVYCSDGGKRVLLFHLGFLLGLEQMGVWSRVRGVSGAGVGVLAVAMWMRRVMQRTARPSLTRSDTCIIKVPVSTPATTGSTASWTDDDEHKDSGSGDVKKTATGGPDDDEPDGDSAGDGYPEGEEDAASDERSPDTLSAPSAWRGASRPGPSASYRPLSTSTWQPTCSAPTQRPSKHERARSQPLLAGTPSPSAAAGKGTRRSVVQSYSYDATEPDDADEAGGRGRLPTSTGPTPALVAATPVPVPLPSPPASPPNAATSLSMVLAGPDCVHDDCIGQRWKRYCDAAPVEMSARAVLDTEWPRQHVDDAVLAWIEFAGVPHEHRVAIQWGRLAWGSREEKDADEEENNDTGDDADWTTLPSLPRTVDDDPDATPARSRSYRYRHPRVTPRSSRPDPSYPDVPSESDARCCGCAPVCRPRCGAWWQEAWRTCVGLVELLAGTSQTTHATLTPAPAELKGAWRQVMDSVVAPSSVREWCRPCSCTMSDRVPHVWWSAVVQGELNAFTSHPSGWHLLAAVHDLRGLVAACALPSRWACHAVEWLASEHRIGDPDAVMVASSGDSDRLGKAGAYQAVQALRSACEVRRGLDGVSLVSDPFEWRHHPTLGFADLDDDTLHHWGPLSDTEAYQWMRRGAMVAQWSVPSAW